MLAVTDIRVEFGGVVAVADVSMNVDRNEAVAVIGPNGSGKTTLLNAVCGLVPAKGTVEMDGETLTMGRAVKIARAGIARTFQTPQVIDELSCIDNVLLSSTARRGANLGAVWLGRPAMLRIERERWRTGTASLERFGLLDMAEEPAGRLTYGQRRWLELARVATAAPRYLLADEPSAGLNDSETTLLAEYLRALRDDGVGIALIDHKVEFLRSVADRAIVLALGHKVAEASIEDVWALEAVKDAYLGGRRVPT